MLSVNQTASNYAALSTLKQISKDLQTTQDRIATGLKVSSAADNATVWATAQSLRSDIKSQDAYKAAMTTVKAKADVASASLDKVVDILNNMKTAIGDAVNTSVAGAADTNAAVQKKLAAFKVQLLAAVKGANLNGTNMLTSGAATSVAIGKDASGADITLDLSSFTKVIDTANLTGNTSALNATVYDGTDATTIANTSYRSVYNMTTFDGTTTTLNITNATSTLSTAISTLTTLRDSISGYSSALESQADFMQKMTDIRKSALSDLVDADMSEESAKVSSLQVKQQLAYQALSIGNNSSQNILRLFQ